MEEREERTLPNMSTNCGDAGPLTEVGRLRGSSDRSGVEVLLVKVVKSWARCTHEALGKYTREKYKFVKGESNVQKSF